MRHTLLSESIADLRAMLATAERINPASDGARVLRRILAMKTGTGKGATRRWGRG